VPILSINRHRPGQTRGRRDRAMEDPTTQDVDVETLIEDVSIDGMCGVY
jgi:mycofactocin precursor